MQLASYTNCWLSAPATVRAGGRQLAGIWDGERLSAQYAMATLHTAGKYFYRSQ